MTPKPAFDDDVEHTVPPALRVALQMVMPGTSGSVWGSRAYLPADEGIAALATLASYGGPLDPVTPGSGERWMGVLRELITINLDLAATAGRLWFEALSIRQSVRPEDRAWATLVIALTEILRGHVRGAQRWMEAADAEADPQEHRPWIADTCKKLGLGEHHLVVPDEHEADHLSCRRPS